MPDKIAIFGGSFNPIHLGHIKVAQYAAGECGLTKVIFLPNANPPHKLNYDMVSSNHRFNMVSLAVMDYPIFEVSDYEMKTQNPSYTIDTMRAMKNEYDAELFFIIGADSLYTLHTWKDYNNLIKECSFIVADRNCSEGTSLKEAADSVINSGGNVTLISMPRVDITSTQIRNLILNDGNINGLLPEKFYDYICNNNLYKFNSEDKR